MEIRKGCERVPERTYRSRILGHTIFPHYTHRPQEAEPKIGSASFFITFLDFFLILFD